MSFETLKLAAAIAVLSSLLPIQAQAKVDAKEAARLGQDLTPTGAIKAGDSALGIPEWKGGLSSPPASYKAGGFETDPFADQKPILVIDASNYKQYQDKLSDGVKALFAAYPNTFKIPVYPTERTYAAPKEVYENTAKNAVNAELVEGGNGFTNAYGGIPFPIPKSGLEAIWNHIARWRGLQSKDISSVASVYENGSVSSYREMNEFFQNYYAPGKDASSIGNILFKYMNRVLPPSRFAGEIYLVHETINQVKEPRMAWTYMSGQRRVRRAPTVGYDTPDTGRLYDDNDMFNGAPDRFTWKIVGVKPYYVPYNNYKMGEQGLKYEDVLHRSHVNPDVTRWEMHRVWVVEADLKPGERHVYSKRRLYLDEDSWAALMAESYDNRGNLWRVSLAFSKEAYQVPTMAYENIAYLDMTTRDYVLTALRTQEKTPKIYDMPIPPDDYWSPANLRRIGTK
ncbi:DUF1329 domain-containing protein [Pseudomonas sp. BGr12]|uniref:DUF1329 domain-containing protein n=1 Tax=Pseudomonas sp. BGr12 TaxID=2936269 RepID=UPI002559AE43|nr:DUF1329 domain-containing protein [Pseudomonas sp. BJa5]MDL2426295.1 DUF1329 domain-containing protein [Pseudomonas sp. BJa5]